MNSERFRSDNNPEPTTPSRSTSQSPQDATDSEPEIVELAEDTPASPTTPMSPAALPVAREAEEPVPVKKTAASVAAAEKRHEPKGEERLNKKQERADFPVRLVDSMWNVHSSFSLTLTPPFLAPTGPAQPSSPRHTGPPPAMNLSPPRLTQKVPPMVKGFTIPRKPSAVENSKVRPLIPLTGSFGADAGTWPHVDQQKWAVISVVLARR